MCGWQHLNLLHVHAACVRMPSDCCGISLVHSLDHNLPCVTSEGKFQRLKSLVSQWSHHVTSMFPGKYVEDVEGCYSPHLCVGFLFLILYPGFFPASSRRLTHNFVLLLDPPPPSLSFLPSPSPLQHLVLIIGRSCLVGFLSGPLIHVSFFTCPRLSRHHACISFLVIPGLDSSPHLKPWRLFIS